MNEKNINGTINQLLIIAHMNDINARIKHNDASATFTKVKSFGFLL